MLITKIFLSLFIKTSLESLHKFNHFSPISAQFTHSRFHPLTEHKSMDFPVLTNQKSKAYFKEIADVCGINKNLTTHLARHTFATTVNLSNGVSIATVSKMLGHRSLKTTQIYAKVLDSKIADEMWQLKE